MSCHIKGYVVTGVTIWPVSASSWMLAFKYMSEVSIQGSANEEQLKIKQLIMRSFLREKLKKRMKKDPVIDNK